MGEGQDGGEYLYKTAVTYPCQAPLMGEGWGEGEPRTYPIPRRARAGVSKKLKPSPHSISHPVYPVHRCKTSPCLRARAGVSMKLKPSPHSISHPVYPVHRCKTSPCLRARTGVSKKLKPSPHSISHPVYPVHRCKPTPALRHRRSPAMMTTAQIRSWRACRTITRTPVEPSPHEGLSTL